MSTLKIKSDQKKMSVEIDGVELIGLGISRLETKMEACETPKAIMAFDFCDHDVDIDGCNVVVDGVRLPVSVSVALVSKITRHLMREISAKFQERVRSLQHGYRGKDGEEKGRIAGHVVTELTHVVEREMMLFAEDVAKGVKI